MSSGFSPRQIDGPLRQTGRAYIAEIAKLVDQHDIESAPGPRSATIIDTAIQTVSNAWCQDNQTPEAALYLIQAVAHLAAMCMAQQHDPEAAFNDFAQMVGAGVVEYQADMMAMSKGGH